MKSLKIALLLSFPIVAEIIVSCSPCDCPEPEPAPYYSCNLSVEHVEFVSGKPYISYNDTIDKNNYGIWMQIERSQFQCFRETTSPSYSFVSSAYACSCVPTYEFYPQARVTDLRIYTTNDFDGTHPAGSNVSNYFSVDNENLFDHANGIDTMLTCFDGMGNCDETFSHSYISLNTAPTNVGPHSFIVELDFLDGSSKQVQTNSVVLM